MAGPNTNYNNLSAITRDLFIPRMVDNIYNSNPLLQRWRKNQLVKTGGNKIVQPLLYAKSTAGGWYSGSDTLNTTPNDTFTNAEWEWAQSHEAITISRADELKNGGEGQIIDFVKASVQNAEESLADRLGTGLFNAGTTPNAIIGLRLMVAATGTYGNIAKATYSWWQSQVNSTSTALTLPLMQAMYGDCSIGNSKPTVLVGTQDIYDDYYNLLQPQQRFTDTKTVDAGFENIMFNRAPVLVDSHCPSGYLFFLNEKYIDLVVMKDENFRFRPFTSPENQNAATAHIFWMGGLICSNCRMQGVFSAIA